MPIPITLLYGGLSIALLTFLGVRVTLARGKTKAFSTELPAEALRLPVRIHGNAAEWIPPGILLLLLLELSGLGSTALHVLGGAFLTGRIIHAVGMALRSGVAGIGAGLNYVVMTVMSLWVVVQHFLR